MNSPTVTIGIDVGTSGCRAVAVAATGEVRAEARAPFPEPEGRDGCREQDPEVWWRAVADCIGRIAADLRAEPVTALAVDGTSGTLLLTDADGQPCTPGLLYNDRRAVAEARRIAAVAPVESGAHGATSALAKLLYLQPRAGDRVRHALHQADWIAGRLTGRWGVSDENNALKLGYDPRLRDWPDWLPGLGVPVAWLPRVVAPGRTVGRLAAEVAGALGLPASVEVVAGTTDSVAGVLATGVHDIGDAVTSLGSTLALKVWAEVPVFAPEHGVYSHRLGERWLVGGASNSGGAVLLEYFDRHELDRLTPALRPNRLTGLDYYPLAAPGERFPVADPEWPPRLEPRPADRVDFLQGMLEGITAIERDGYRLLAELGAPYPRRVVTTGRGAANEPWRRMRERALGVPVEQAEHWEAAYGTALLAARG